MAEIPVLTAMQAAAFRDAVASGEYASAEAALADAVDIWSHRAEARAEELAWVRARIRTSLADPDPDLSEDEVEERLRVMFETSRQRTDEAA